MISWGVYGATGRRRGPRPHRSISRYLGRVGGGGAIHCALSLFYDASLTGAIGIDITPSRDTPDPQDYRMCGSTTASASPARTITDAGNAGGTDYAAAFAADAGDHRARK